MSPRRLDPSIVHARLATMRDMLDDLATVGDRYVEQCAAYVTRLEY